MSLPDAIVIKISGPTAWDIGVEHPDGRAVWGVEEVTITYRADEIASIRVAGVDLDGPVSEEGDLPSVSRTYEVALHESLAAEFKALALIEQPT